MTRKQPADPPANKPAARARKRTEPAQNDAEQGKQPADSGTKRRSNVTKLVRKGRRVTEGAKLRRQLSKPNDEYTVKLLITQAARHADRLEVLDRLLSGDPAVWLAVKIEGTVAEVRVDKAMIEERQRSDALRRLLMDIDQIRADSGSKGGGAVKVDDPMRRVEAARA